MNNRKIHCLYLLFVGISVLGIVYLSYSRLTYPWLWYDEAGQFWISKGLHHYSDPFSEPLGVWQVIINNRYYNLDPGGFSILLHYWLLISNHYLFIHLLPLLFFLGFAYLVYKLVLEYTHRRPYAFVCCVLVFVFDTTVSRMTEVRAYSMEMYGIMLTMCYLVKWEKESYKSFILPLFISFILAIFCTSRYEFILFAFCVTLYVLFRIYKNSSKPILIGFCFCLLPICSVLFVIFVTLQYQNPSISKLGHVRYLGDNLWLLCGRLFLAYLLNSSLVVYSFFKRKVVNSLQFISFAVPTIIVILSLFQKYPWDNIRSISVTVLLLANLSTELYNRYNYRPFIAVIVVMICFIGKPPSLYGNQHSRFLEFVAAVNKRYKDKSMMFVDDWFNPSVRYVYEYGIFSENRVRDDYPSSFVFQHRIPKQLKPEGDRFPVPPLGECDVFLIGRPSNQIIIEDIAIPYNQSEYLYIRNGK